MTRIFKENMYKCGCCGLNFQKIDALKKHINDSHKIETEKNEHQTKASIEWVTNLKPKNTYK